jgi:autotransporter-associated beta strand protein
VISDGPGARDYAILKTGNSTFSLTKPNDYGGGTTVSGGTLQAAAATGGALGSSGVTVNNGGTLLLGANHQINDTATMTLAGGTFAKGNFNEGSTSSVGMGALTLTASGSKLDFGAGTVGILTFASFSPGVNTLTIDNWTGTAETVGSASTDRLIFNSTQASNLDSFSFAGYGTGSMQFALGGGYYEVVPLAAIPEPETWLSAICLVGAVAWHWTRVSRRRRALPR